jgi:hypothetical protein
MNQIASKIRSVSSGKLLTVPGLVAEPARRLEQHDDNGGDNQIWNLLDEPSTNDAYRLYVQSGNALALDAEASGRLDHTAVIVWYDRHTANQYWILDPIDINTGRFVIFPSYFGPLVEYALVMDVTGGSDDNGAPIQLFHPNGGQNQQWELVVTDIFHDPPA